MRYDDLNKLAKIQQSKSQYTNAPTDQIGISGGAGGSGTYYHVICKMCGGESYSYLDDDPLLCTSCGRKIKEYMYEQYFNNNISKEDQDYCQDCKKHIKACHCPKREALKELRK